MNTLRHEPTRGTPWWPWRRIALAGLLFVLAIAALAAYDIVRSYGEAVDETGRDLRMQARVVAEHATRSLQAVDGVLRYVAADSRQGVLGRRSPADLHAYLRSQVVGLSQVDALMVFDANGRLLASSLMPQETLPAVDIGDEPAFRFVRESRPDTTLVGPARLGRLLTSGWYLPVARRLETSDGRFAGAVAASVRVDFFDKFYRDLRLDEGGAAALVHDDGTLIARAPDAGGGGAAIGRRFTAFDAPKPAAVPAASETAAPAAAEPVVRAVSPLDGREHYGIRAAVPERSLSVVLTRDAKAALAPWRERSIGTAWRTLALVALALALLAMLRRQLLRLARTRDSLELSRERFALAAAGSQEGIWDWDIRADVVYASPRAREIFGVAQDTETTPRAAWRSQLDIHPDDMERRNAAMNEHLDGRRPVYAVEYRVRRAAAAGEASGEGPAWRWVRVRGLAVRDAGGQPLRMAGSVTDIDAHRRAEDALRVSEERYALAMAGLTGGHWVWEVETDALFASPSIHRLFGLPDDTPLTTRVAYYRWVTVHPEDLPALARLNDDIAAGRLSRMDFEYRILLPGSRQVRWILTRAQAFPGPDGKPLRMAGVSVDITPRKETEQALRLSEERFALAVAGSNDGILDWDIVNDRMYASERAMRMLGVESNVT